MNLIFELGRSPGGGYDNPLQYSCLENPHGQKSLVGYSHTQLSDYAQLNMVLAGQGQLKEMGPGHFGKEWVGLEEWGGFLKGKMKENEEGKKTWCSQAYG